MKAFLSAVCLMLSLVMPSQVLAEEKTNQIPRTTLSASIDGDLSDPIWQQAKQVQILYNTWPQDSTAAEVKTTAYIIENGEYLYVAFLAEDPEPEKIRASYRKRDRMFQDDFVGVILDTFNDERRGFEFFVNPLGAQGDLTVDDTNGGQEDENWDTLWDSAGKITDTGFQVEMAIPFRNLRYQADLAEQTWGIEFLRKYPRDARNNLLSTPRDRALDCGLCQMAKYTGMPNLKSATTNIEFTPTLTYVSGESRDIDPVSPWETTTDETEFGLDMRWAITEDWILNTTINPDFSQVEIDGAQLDVNTTFSLYFPEKRPFFLEGADYFNTMNRLVHTRNIADPDFGTKLTGKQDGYTVGLIAARDATTSFLIPSIQGSHVESLDGVESDVLIGRVQKDIGEKSNIGMLVTSRNGDDYSNTVTSVDGRYYFDDHNLIRYQVMHSETDNPDSIRFDDDGDEQLAASQSDNALTLNYRHMQKDYWIYASYYDYGEDFRADSGFIGRVDYKQAVLGGHYNWWGEEGSDWTRVRLNGDWDKTEDQSGQKIEEEVEAYLSINGPLQFFAQTGYLVRDRFYDDVMYKEKWWSTYFEFRPFKNLRVENYYRNGDMIDFRNSRLGNGWVWESWVDLTLGRHFNMTMGRDEFHLKVPGGELFEAIQYDVRLGYQFDHRSRLSLTVQYTDIGRNPDLYNNNFDDDPDNDVGSEFEGLSTQLIYSYKLDAKTLFYIGYSDAGYADDFVPSLKKTDKTLFAKFSYHYQL